MGPLFMLRVTGFPVMLNLVTTIGWHVYRSADFVVTVVLHEDLHIRRDRRDCISGQLA